MRVRRIVAAALWLLAAQAHAADEAAVLSLRAEELAAQDRCDEAVPRAERARELAPDDARAALVIGRCALQAGRYAEAIEPLEAARRLDPSLQGVSTDLAQAHYHLDQLAPAETEVGRALESDPDDARALLYQGLVLLRRSENAAAAESLDRASRLDSRMQPTASFYAGLAWEHARERERAEAALERARAEDPDGPWGREAERALERLDAPYRKHRWALLRAGVEHDTNVALSAFDRATTTPVAAEEEDQRGFLEAEAGFEFWRTPDWSAGVSGGYDGTAQFDLHIYDVQYPWIVAWLDHRFDERTWLRIKPFGGYQWLETDPFVAHGGLQLGLDRQLGETLVGRLLTSYSYNDYLFRIPDDPFLTLPQVVAVAPGANAAAKRRRNRDGSELHAGAELELPIAQTDTRLWLGSTYDLYDSEGKDWAYDGVRGWFEIAQRLPWKLDLDAYATYEYRGYDHPSSFVPANVFVFGPNHNRIDKVWEVGGELERPLVSFVRLGVRTFYSDQDSNVAVFDYDRFVIGGYLELEWGGSKWRFIP